MEPISIPISGLLITKIEFITQILTQQPTTVSGHSRLSQKSPKFLQFPSHVLGRIKRPFPGPFPYQTCLFNTKFPHKQHPTFWTVPAPKKISQINSNNSVPNFGTDQQPIPGIFSMQTRDLKPKIWNFKDPKQPLILDSHGWGEKSPIISNNSVPCFGTDQTAPHGLKPTETSKNT